MTAVECSLSRFLNSYAPDRFEWEDPDYCPRARFLWKGPLASFSPPCHGIDDYDYARDDSNAIFHHLNVHSSFDDDNDPSDMSISVSSGSLRSTSLGESFAFDGNISVGDRLTDSTLNEIESRMKFSYSFGDMHDVDGNACSKILEWMTALFAEVAGSLMDCEASLDERRPAIPCDFLGDFLTTAVSLDVYGCSGPESISPTVTVNISGLHPPGLPFAAPRSLQPNASLVAMPDTQNEDVLAHEQITTAKQVCMWGRRLERIPKVRVPGQKEPVYCFDARKQKQKQTQGKAPTSQLLNPKRVPQPQPTQVFYRARPLNRPFAAADLATGNSILGTRIDGVKVTQGRVLLQNVSPIRFDSAPSPPLPRDPAFSAQLNCPPTVICGPAIPSRMPLGPRTNSFRNLNVPITHFQSERRLIPRPLQIKNIPGPSFVDALRGYSN